jgi:hypothetical protein
MEDRSAYAAAEAKTMLQVFKNSDIHGIENGGEEEDRTPDLCIANAALSQLSYFPRDVAARALAARE